MPEPKFSQQKEPDCPAITSWRIYVMYPTYLLVPMKYVCGYNIADTLWVYNLRLYHIYSKSQFMHNQCDDNSEQARKKLAKLEMEKKKKMFCWCSINLESQRVSDIL